MSAGGGGVVPRPADTAIADVSTSLLRFNNYIWNFVTLFGMKRKRSVSATDLWCWISAAGKCGDPPKEHGNGKLA
jgi:hypothetical protein